MTIITKLMGLGEYMQNAKDIFADNVDALLNRAEVSIKPLVDQANATGEDIDYSYVTRVRNNKINPSLVKSEQIVRVLKFIEGFESIELWMFLVPNFFRNGSTADFQSLKSTNVDMVQFTKELLFALKTMRTIDISEKQYDDILNVAEYLSKKSSAGLNNDAGIENRKAN